MLDPTIVAARYCDGIGGAFGLQGSTDSGASDNTVAVCTVVVVIVVRHPRYGVLASSQTVWFETSTTVLSSLAALMLDLTFRCDVFFTSVRFADVLNVLTSIVVVTVDVVIVAFGL